MSVWAFGTGFANAISNNMERSKDETASMRKAMIQRYSSLADQYIVEKKKASEVIKTESIYKSMGIPPQLASLAAYSGVAPDKLGEFMRQYEVVDNVNVRNRKDNQVLDVAKMTGSAPPPSPENITQVSAGQNSPSNQGANSFPGMGGSGAGANNTGQQSSPNLPFGGAQTQPSMEVTSNAGTPHNGTYPAEGSVNGSDFGTKISHLLSGRGDISKAHQTAVRDLAHIYGVSPEQFMQMASGTGYDEQVPDVSGIRPRNPLELEAEDLDLRTAAYNKRFTSRGSGGTKWTQSDMNNIATIRAQNLISELTEDDPDYLEKMTDPKGLLAKYKAQAMADIYAERQQGDNPLMAATKDLIGQGTDEGASIPSRGEVASNGIEDIPNDMSKLVKGKTYNVDGDAWVYLGGDPSKETSWSK